MCVCFKTEEDKAEGGVPISHKGPWCPHWGIWSLFWGGGGGSLRQSARSVLYNQAVPPLSRAHLHAQEDQGPGGSLLVGQGEWSQVALGNLVCRILCKFHDLLFSISVSVMLGTDQVAFTAGHLHGLCPEELFQLDSSTPSALSQQVQAHRGRPSRCPWNWIKTALFALGMRYPRTPPKTQATRQVAGAPLLKSATFSKSSLIITNYS